MTRHPVSLAGTALGAMLGLALAAAPALAAHGGGGHGGGGHGGSGGHGGYGGHSGYGHVGYGGYGRGFAYGGYGRGYGSYGRGYGGYGGYGRRYGYGGRYYGGYGGYGGFYGLGLTIGGYPDYGYDYSYPSYSDSGYTPSIAGYATPGFDATPPVLSTAPVPAYDEPAAPDDRSQVEVRVPVEDAQVFFNGAPTRQTGTDRVFMSPPLTPGKTYQYTIEARWMENGRTVNQTRNVNVAVGRDPVVDFTAPPAP